MHGQTDVRQTVKSFTVHLEIFSFISKHDFIAYAKRNKKKKRQSTSLGCVSELS